jgi:hypothetical protein
MKSVVIKATCFTALLDSISCFGLPGIKISKPFFNFMD